MMHTAVGAWTQLGDGRPSEAAVGGPATARPSSPPIMPSGSP